MNLDDIAMVVANTDRSKAYIQSLVQNNLLPNFVLIMHKEHSRILPGQHSKENQNKTAGKKSLPKSEMLGLVLNTEESLETTLKRSQIPFCRIHSENINSVKMIKALSSRPESVFIYSGYGGMILREKVLSIGKNFLHIHGGYLPDYKGSTTNYYSLIIDNECGASSIFLNKEIDCGPIIIRRKFPPPPDRSKIDYIYDSIIRANVLVETIESYLEWGANWQFELEKNEGGETYYIMHPLLRHITILADG